MLKVFWLQRKKLFRRSVIFSCFEGYIRFFFDHPIVNVVIKCYNTSTVDQACMPDCEIGTRLVCLRPSETRTFPSQGCGTVNTHETNDALLM